MQGSQESAAVTFMSFNPTGLDSSAKCRFSNNICKKFGVDFLTIQEHFKFTTNQYFKKKFPDFNSYVIPAYRSPGQDTGRAKAGLAQLSRRGLQIKKERVITKGYRVQAQILNLPSSRVLWINTYLPTDPKLIGEYDDTDLREILAEVEGVLAGTIYDDVIWGLDLNWDISRNTSLLRP